VRILYGTEQTVLSRIGIGATYRGVDLPFCDRYCGLRTVRVRAHLGDHRDGRRSPALGLGAHTPSASLWTVRCALDVVRS